MTKLLPAAAERWRTSSVDMNVVVIPVMGASGSPILKSSAVGVNHGTPTFFLIRATTSRAVTVDGDWPAARTNGDAARRPVPATWQNFLRDNFIDSSLCLTQHPERVSCWNPLNRDFCDKTLQPIRDLSAAGLLRSFVAEQD